MRTDRERPRDDLILRLTAAITQQTETTNRLQLAITEHATDTQRRLTERAEQQLAICDRATTQALRLMERVDDRVASTRQELLALSQRQLEGLSNQLALGLRDGMAAGLGGTTEMFRLLPNIFAEAFASLMPNLLQSFTSAATSLLAQNTDSTVRLLQLPPPPPPTPPPTPHTTLVFRQRNIDNRRVTIQQRSGDTSGSGAAAAPLLAPGPQTIAAIVPRPMPSVGEVHGEQADDGRSAVVTPSIGQRRAAGELTVGQKYCVAFAAQGGETRKVTGLCNTPGHITDAEGREHAVATALSWELLPPVLAGDAQGQRESRTSRRKHRREPAPDP